MDLPWYGFFFFETSLEHHFPWEIEFSWMLQRGGELAQMYWNLPIHGSPRFSHSGLLLRSLFNKCTITNIVLQNCFLWWKFSGLYCHLMLLIHWPSSHLVAHFSIVYFDLPFNYLHMNSLGRRDECPRLSVYQHATVILLINLLPLFVTWISIYCICCQN